MWFDVIVNSVAVWASFCELTILWVDFHCQFILFVNRSFGSWFVWVNWLLFLSVTFIVRIFLLWLDCITNWFLLWFDFLWLDFCCKRVFIVSSFCCWSVFCQLIALSIDFCGGLFFLVGWFLLRGRATGKRVLQEHLSYKSVITRPRLGSTSPNMGLTLPRLALDNRLEKRGPNKAQAGLQ